MRATCLLTSGGSRANGTHPTSPRACGGAMAGLILMGHQLLGGGTQPLPSTASAPTAAASARGTLGTARAFHDDRPDLQTLASGPASAARLFHATGLTHVLVQVGRVRGVGGATAPGAVLHRVLRRRVHGVLRFHVHRARRKRSSVDGRVEFWRIIDDRDDVFFAFLSRRDEKRLPRRANRRARPRALPSTETVEPGK